MTWLHPLAWWGLVGIASPFIIHMLTRHRSRRVLFPSLKFLPASQVPALRRRVLSDWPLLILRALIIALSTAALAAPVLVSEARRASWNQRVARAIVVPLADSAASVSLVDEEARTSFSHARFSSAAMVDALTESVEWLQRQPPAAREIVIIGDLREGVVAERDLQAVPPFVGVRFLPTVRAASPSGLELAAIADARNGRAASYRVHVVAEQLQTRARYEVESATDAPRIRIVADPSNQSYADALLRAVLREGVMLGRQAERSLTLAFRGAPPATASGMPTPNASWMQRLLETNQEIKGGEVDGALLARVDMPVTDDRAPRLVARVIREAFADAFDPLEPRRITPAAIARWSRPPATSPPDALPTDEGDRRWFWGAALIALAIEQIARARRKPQEPGRAAELGAEARNEENRVA